MTILLQIHLVSSVFFHAGFTWLPPGIISEDLPCLTCLVQGEVLAASEAEVKT